MPKLQKIIFLYCVFQVHIIFLSGQGPYFPPSNDAQWERTSPESLGWDTVAIEMLYSYLEAENSKAFIVLKDGKIVLEKYFGSTGRNTP